MASGACSTALLTCSFGVSPVPLTVLPTTGVTATMPLGNITSNTPMACVPSFGMCSAPANPLVIAATAAALGVPTPSACIPATTAPWIPGAPTVLTGNMPTLTSSCKLMCMYGGVITITYPGQITASISG